MSSVIHTLMMITKHILTIFITTKSEPNIIISMFILVCENRETMDILSPLYSCDVVAVDNLYHCLLIITTSLVSKLHDNRACNFNDIHKICSHRVVSLHFSLYNNVHSLLHASLLLQPFHVNNNDKSIQCTCKTTG